MAEAIHCPSCSTRYRLRPERLTPAIRRARCFSCGVEFPLGDAIQRLSARPDSGVPGDLRLEEAEIPDRTESIPDEPSTPTLTLGDLDDVDAETLEGPLPGIPAVPSETQAATAPHPPAPAFAASDPVFPPEITETTLSGYTSARDAIDKLFGNVPAPSTGLKVNREPGAMDVEATLSALESTLGASPSAPSTGMPAQTGSAFGLPREDDDGSSNSTMRLSQEELRAAIAATHETFPSTTGGGFRASGWTPDQPAEPAASSYDPRAITAAGGAPEAGAELLRLKTRDEIYGGLTMPQLIAWVEEGRILENHMVARQHSENWLEAHKVPGLRPIFERLRRERGRAPSLDPVPTSDIAPKKSLFGGLFGKN